jgi:hypothetical protein
MFQTWFLEEESEQRIKLNFLAGEISGLTY